MFYSFVRAEPPKKKARPGPCLIGAEDDNNLGCNQCLQDNGQRTAATQTDAITLAPLEPDHIEYVSPDKTLKCCYNPSTVDKCRSPQGQLLQPPHFRLPMSQEDAAKIHGRFPQIAVIKREGTSFGRDYVEPRVQNNRTLQLWARMRMSGLKLWVCPVCWARLTIEEGAYETIVPQRKRTDPVGRCLRYVLLTGIDGLRELAGCMSTTKTGIREHLKRVHDCRMPSELLDIYQLGGGLLHAYLLQRGWSNSSSHGALLSYWRGGGGMSVGIHKWLFLILHAIVNRGVPTAALPGYESSDTPIIRALAAPYSNEETAEDREFIDNSKGSSQPVYNQLDRDANDRESAQIRDKVAELERKGSEGYLTHEELLELERLEQSAEREESSSEDEYETFAERKERLAREAHNKKQNARKELLDDDY